MMWIQFNFLSKFDISKLNYGHCADETLMLDLKKEMKKKIPSLSLKIYWPHHSAQAAELTFLIISYTLNLLMSCQMLKNVENDVKMPIAFPDDDDCSMFVSNPTEKWQIKFSCLSVSNDALWNAPKY